VNVGTPPVSEPKVIVRHREDLWWLLTEAAQLEHMIMCQYLYAEFSLKGGVDEGLTAGQAQAVERWRKLLRGIAVEEMLHLALVSNLMASIGAAPTFRRPNFPQRSRYFPSSIQLDLLPFGEQALKHFLYLERPEGLEREDADGFVPSAPAREPLTEDELMPRGQEFLTIGHLYRGIEDGMRGLTDGLGERGLFVGSPRAQATPELVNWPQLIAVTGLDSALAAVEEIIEQGEGVRVLQLLTRFFTHTDESDEQLQLLIGTSMELMAAVLRPLGVALTKLPVGPEHQERTAGLAFEMYYQMGNFVPWRDSAWALLHERTALLHDKSASLAELDGAPSIIADVGQRTDTIAAKLAAHV